MTKMRRANVVLHVEDDEVQHYLNLGYDVISKGNKVERNGVANDVGALKAALAEAQKKCLALEGEVANLTAQLQQYKAIAEKDAKKAERASAKKAKEPAE